MVYSSIRKRKFKKAAGEEETEKKTITGRKKKVNGKSKGTPKKNERRKINYIIYCVNYSFNL